MRASAKVAEKEGKSCGERRSIEQCSGHRSIMASYKNNTSQDKGWIFDSGSTVHVCSQKELFNSLAAKEEGIIKMVDGSAWRSLALGQSRLQKEMGRYVL